MGLDDVIIQKKKEIEGLDGTIKAHTNRIEELVNQVRAKQTELAEKAKQSLAVYEPRLVFLMSEVKTLETKVVELNDLIAQKHQAVTDAEKREESRFVDLEKSLHREVNAKMSNLEAKADALNKMEEEISKRDFSIIAREQAIVASEAKAREAENLLSRDRESLAAERESIRVAGINLRESQEAYQAMTEEIGRKKVEADNFLASLRVREEEAVGAMARAKQAEKDLADIQAVLAETQKLDAERTVLAEKNKADRAKLNGKEDRLVEWESKLKKREQNLEALRGA